MILKYQGSAYTFSEGIRVNCNMELLNVVLSEFYQTKKVDGGIEDDYLITQLLCGFDPTMHYSVAFWGT